MRAGIQVANRYMKALGRMRVALALGLCLQATPLWAQAVCDDVRRLIRDKAWTAAEQLLRQSTESAEKACAVYLAQAYVARGRDAEARTWALYARRFAHRRLPADFYGRILAYRLLLDATLDEEAWKKAWWELRTYAAAWVALLEELAQQRFVEQACASKQHYGKTCEPIPSLWMRRLEIEPAPEAAAPAEAPTQEKPPAPRPIAPSEVVMAPPAAAEHMAAYTKWRRAPQSELQVRRVLAAINELLEFGVDLESEALRFRYLAAYYDFVSQALQASRRDEQRRLLRRALRALRQVDGEDTEDAEALLQAPRPPAQGTSFRDPAMRRWFDQQRPRLANGQFAAAHRELEAYWQADLAYEADFRFAKAELFKRWGEWREKQRRYDDAIQNYGVSGRFWPSYQSMLKARIISMLKRRGEPLWTVAKGKYLALWLELDADIDAAFDWPRLFEPKMDISAQRRQLMGYCRRGQCDKASSTLGLWRRQGKLTRQAYLDLYAMVFELWGDARLRSKRYADAIENYGVSGEIDAKRRPRLSRRIQDILKRQDAPLSIVAAGENIADWVAAHPDIQALDSP